MTNNKEFILDSEGNETRIGDKIYWGDDILTVLEIHLEEDCISADNDECNNYIYAAAETFDKVAA